MSDSALHAATARSPVPCGRIVEVRLPEIPPLCVAIDASRIPGRNRLEHQGLAMPFLAEGSAAYLGEPVVLLAAPDRAQAESLARQVVVACDAAPAPPAGAAGPGCVREIAFERGDAEAAFQSAARVVEGSYSTGYQEGLTASSFGVLARPGDREMHVSCTSPDPFLLRDNVAALLGRAPARVRVHAEPGPCPLARRAHFATLLAGHAALLADASGRPVRLVYAQRECLAFTPKRPPCVARYRSALDEEGLLTAMDVELDFDAGAYPVFCAPALESALIAACGGYRCDNVRVRARLLSGPHAPTGTLPGSGEVQAFFALELHADRIAAHLGLSPWEWRRRQLEGVAVFPCGMRWNREEPLQLLEDVLKRSDFRRKWAAYEAARKRRVAAESDAGPAGGSAAQLTIVGRAPIAAALDDGPLRGIGLALAFHGVGRLAGDESHERSTVRVVLDHDKKLRIASSQGADGQAASWARTAAGLLDIPLDDVVLEPVDTGEVPDSGPAAGSRIESLLEDLVAQASRAVRAQKLKRPPPIQVTRSHRKPAGAVWSPDSPRGQAYHGLCWEATVVEMEVDPITFHARCRGVWTTLEGGADSNGDATEALIEGAILYNLDFLLLDKGRYVEGAWVERVPGDQPVLGVLDSPQSHIVVLDRAKRGFGDLPVVAAAPAAALAVAQGVGRPVTSGPLSPELLACGDPA